MAGHRCVVPWLPYVATVFGVVPHDGDNGSPAHRIRDVRVSVRRPSLRPRWLFRFARFSRALRALRPVGLARLAIVQLRFASCVKFRDEAVALFVGDASVLRGFSAFRRYVAVSSRAWR